MTHSHQPTETDIELGSSEEITDSNSNSQISNSNVNDNQPLASDEPLSPHDDQSLVSDAIGSDVNDSISNKISASNNSDSNSQRPKRLAAMKGRQRSPDDPYIHY